MDVGIREFKARLSHYMRAAVAGETVRITRHGKVLLELTPVPADEDWRERGVREGWLRLPTRTPDGRGPSFIAPADGRNLSDLISEDRDSR